MTKYSHARSYLNFLILPTYQWQFVGVYAVLGITLIATNLQLFYSFCKNCLYMFSVSAPVTIGSDPQMKLFLFLFIVLSMLILIVLLIGGLILSHRSAGAIYHIHKVLKSAAQGDRSARVQLRRDDEHRELADSINYLLERMR